MAEETKATKSKESSQPKSVASSVSVEGRPSSHGLDRRRSWSPERKQRHGDERQDSPRHQSSRRDGSRRESERSRPSSSGGSSSRRRAESGSVSKASDTRPSASSSQHHHHSSGDHRSLSSSSSPASPDRRCPASHERRRESADRTGSDVRHQMGCQAVPQAFQAAWEENDQGGLFAGPAGSCWIVPRSSVPAPVADGPAGADPTAGNGSDTGGDLATCNGTAAGHRCNGTATGDGPATGDGLVTVDDPASDDPADVSEVESELYFDEPDEIDSPARLPTEAQLGTPVATSPGDGPDISRSTGTSSLLFPSIPRSTSQGLHVNVDFTTASDGPVQCSSGSSQSSRPGSSSGSQTWLNHQGISHAG